MLALVACLVGFAAPATAVPLSDNCTKTQGTVACFEGPGQNQADVGTTDETQGNTTNTAPAPQDLDCTVEPATSQGKPDQCSITITPTASSYINLKNSVNSDHYIKMFRVRSDGSVYDTQILLHGENAVKYNGDGSVRIKVYLADSIDSYQYNYGGTWKSCHDWIGNDISNPTDDYYDVTIRTFYSADCDGRN